MNGTRRLLLSHNVTFNVQLETNVAERKRLLLGAQLADAADIVIVQVDAHELLLVHSALGRVQRGATSDGTVISTAPHAKPRLPRA